MDLSRLRKNLYIINLATRNFPPDGDKKAKDYASAGWLGRFFLWLFGRQHTYDVWVAKQITDIDKKESDLNPIIARAQKLGGPELQAAISQTQPILTLAPQARKPEDSPYTAPEARKAKTQAPGPGGVEKPEPQKEAEQANGVNYGHGF